MSRFTASLNPQQARAVQQTQGPVLVLAGAGSGKTRVITNRIAYILSRKLAKPSEILAVTFTNKAAAEMRERVADLIGKKKAGEVMLSTFHSFCLKVLRKHIEHIGYRRNFTISGDGDVKMLLRRILDDLGAGQDSFNTGSFQASISLFKNSEAEQALRTSEEDSDIVARSLAPPETETDQKYYDYIDQVFARYQSSLRAANSVDFDDLLLLTLQVWREHPRILARFQKHYRYVMVDEYQDTNGVQLALMNMLVKKHQNFCVVGDDDQSIYGWRGADSGNILEFERHFPDATIVTLDQNYRSTETILKAANSVIRNNTTRRDKKLWSDLGKGRTIDWVITGDEEEEARQAVLWLRHIQKRTGARYRDFALLYRSNIQSKVLEIAFRQEKIPVVVFGGQEFFERAEVKDILAYLKVVVNPHDEAAFLRVVNMPRRGIGDATLHRIHEICRKEKISLGRAMAIFLKENRSTAHDQMALGQDMHSNAHFGKAERGIRDFLGILNKFRKRFRDRDASLKEIVEDLVVAIDYHGELENSCKTPEQLFNRWQNVELVIKALGDYEEGSDNPTLSEFLDVSHLNGDQDRESKDERSKNSVSFMTVHSSKGLEFPFVFIMGVEEGLLPHERSLRENSLDEERRLFYVALTRGRRHVTLFEALSRARFGKERMTKTSRFVEEIPEELLSRQVKAVREMVEEQVAPPEPKQKKKRPPRKQSPL
jgi:superfamily I DNA/RNA helicase